MKKKKNRNHMPSRLNILFLIVFLMFSVLIVQLASVQIVKNEEFEKEVAKQENSTVSLAVPRGKIYDRNGKVVVDNTQQRAITYTRYKNVENKDMLKTAEKLAQYITISPDELGKLTERDKQDYWLITRDPKGEIIVTKEEQKVLKEQGKKNEDVYELQRERLKEDKLKELDGELEKVAIFTKMKSGYKMTPQMIKNEGVTNEEFAIVSERLEELPGVDVTSDWTRSYPSGDTLRSVLGSVTDEGRGLPDDQLEYYLARDYNRNDRVGKSYIEQQYEDILHGKKAKVKTELDPTGKKVVDTEVIYEGAQGDNLNLTFDADLQAAVEEIITDEMWKYKKKSGYDLMDRAFAVMMDPYTGEVLSMAGKKINKKEDGTLEMQDYALGAMSSAYEMGSVVKGATILTGYQTDAIKEGQSINDVPYYFGASKKPKKSWDGGLGGMGSLTDQEALKKSSNVYMFRTVMNMMGAGPYTKGMSLPKVTDENNVFDTMRYYFSQFGLGVPTGIDLPNETAGVKGKGDLPGFALDLGIGQYDTYTTLQIAQYISTIANGGYRMKPQIVKSVTEATNKQDEGQRVIDTIDPVVLNKVDMPIGQIQRVQAGFKMVTQPGGTASSFANDPNNPALKTGTAESVTNGVETYNYTLVGYAPYDKPEIAFAVAVPGVRQNGDKGISQAIGRRIMDKYFELKKVRSLNGELPNTENNAQSGSGTEGATNNQSNEQSTNNQQQNVQRGVEQQSAIREETLRENNE
jgi:penicillin-binding protein A